MARLSLTLFGPLRLAADDGSEVPLHADKVRALLAFLAVESGRPHRREELAGLLWPGYPEHSARQSLSQALFTVRQVLASALDGQDGVPLIITRSDVQLNCDGCALDAGTYDALLDACRRHGHPLSAPCEDCVSNLRRALELYQGEFLAGFSLRDSPEFEEWLLVQRERYHRRATEAAAALSHAQAGDQALESARRWVALDPLDEAGHRRLMALLAGSGHRSLAMAHYELCQRTLRTELGIEPEEATRALFESIRSGDPAVVHAPVLVAAPAIIERAPAAAPRPPPRHNLPAPVDSFVGRERELADVRGLVEDPAVRLVTLVGMGGMGKTRLALEVARACLPGFVGCAWIIDLAPLAAGAPAVRDGAVRLPAEEQSTAVAHAITSGLKVFEADKAAGLQGLLGSLASTLEGTPLLLLLDGCEPLIEGVVPVVAQLLARCPELTVLATSREPLRMAGEHLYELEPLALPDTPPPLAEEAPAPDLSVALSTGSVRLLAERAAASRYGVTIDASNLASAVEVCRQVDGIPLAIELAAARLSALTLEELSRRLNGHEKELDATEAARAQAERWTLLSAGSRAAHPRQRALLATLAWSYGLLVPAEQRLFARLSIFSGTFTRQAVEAVCAASDGVPGEVGSDAAALLGRLLDCSLVQRIELPGLGPRYRLLETLRVYAHEHLQESGELGAIAERHATYYAGLAEVADPVIRSGVPELQDVLRQMDADHENLAAAMRWCLAQGRAELAIRIGAGAHYWATYHARIRQYGEWVEAALALPESITPRDRARGLEVVSTFYMRAGRRAEQAELIPRLIMAAREAGDPVIEGWALWHQGTWARDTGDLERAVVLFRQSLALARAAGEEDLAGYDESFLALYEPRGVRLPLMEALVERASYGQRPYRETLCSRLALQDGDLAGAERHYRAAIAGWDGMGNYSMAGRLMRELAAVRALRGDYSELEVLIQRGLALLRQVGDRPGRPILLIDKGAMLWEQGQSAAARAALEEGLRAAQSAGYPGLVPMIQLWLAQVLASEGDLAEAEGLCSQAEVALGSEASEETAVSATVRGWVAHLQGACGDAARHWRRALEQRRQEDWRMDVARAAEHLGWALAGAGELDEAASLLAEAQSEREAIGMVLAPIEQPHHARAIRLVRVAA
jgi:predicted ATPase/DNA-binding SARP family transcriptional activator